MPKIYAAKFIDGTHWIGYSWPDCEKLVMGKPGVKYKSFVQMEDAQAWITGKRVVKKGLRIYVDGSFMPSSEYAGWSWVAVNNGVEIAHDFGITPHPAASRNIDGELYAAWKAMEFLAEKQLKGTICYDYQGVESWATGEWKANSAVSQIYVNRIAELKVWASFEKVVGHGGDEWNERADDMAKGVLIGKYVKKVKPTPTAVAAPHSSPVKCGRSVNKKPTKKLVKVVRATPRGRPATKSEKATKLAKPAKPTKSLKSVKPKKPVKKTKKK